MAQQPEENSPFVETQDSPEEGPFVKDARDEALSAAEKGLEAARAALAAAEAKLAEAQRAAGANTSPIEVDANAEQPQSQQPFQQSQQQADQQVGDQPYQQTYQQPGDQPFQQQPYTQAYQQPNQQQAYGQQPNYDQPNVRPHYAVPTGSKDHVAAGLLAIFFGGLGIHKFYLGYNTQGFIMLAISILGGLFSFGLASGIVWLIAIIEGIIYFTKSQSEFEQIYVFQKREWF